MNTKTLEKFAQSARRQLHEQVGAKLERVRTTDSAELRAKAKMIDALEKEIRQSSREALVEKVAYTWFNRFIALRYMDANHYTRVGAVSPAPGHTQPEILQEAKQGHVDGRLQQYVDEETVFGLLSGRLPSSDPQQEAYRLLLVGVCNYFHTIMPFMFEEIDDYTELLMPDDLLSEGSILHATRQALTPEHCEDVEVIGWLYQFYISEKKDEVIGSKKNIAPMDIPAATQLFTPHWIVRYLVENSLGRLWLLNHPDSRLAERMDYYIEPEEKSGSSKETDFLRVESPEELTVCDPAVGSGHMLTYAFDLLYIIYEEQGYNPTDIPRLILKYNLYGMEIDERAGALAAFALMMKARDKDRRFFRRERDAGGIQPNVNVLQPISFEEDELEREPWLERLEDDQRERLLHDLHLFEEANNFGSLLRPQLMIREIVDIRERVQAEAAPDTLFAHQRRERILQALAQAEYLARKYKVVVANPPYMGRRNMNPRLKKFAKLEYARSKYDLFAMFIERGFNLLAANGYNSMVTMQSWMFLSSYEKFRKSLLSRFAIECMVHMGNMVMGIAFGTAATVWQKLQKPKFQGHFSYVRYEDLTDKNKPREFPIQNARLARASAADFKKVPGSPIAYWISNNVRKAFLGQPLRKHIITEGQNKTADNAQYLRLLWEVDARSTGDSRKWLPYAKGGPYRKWYGNIEHVVDWSEEARAHYHNSPACRIIDRRFWRMEGVTWTDISSSGTGFRYFPKEATFDMKGPTAFFRENELLNPFLSLLNSNFVSYLLPILNPTISTQLRDVRAIPLPQNRNWVREAAAIAVNCRSISKKDWHFRETSLIFEDNPILSSDYCRSTLAGSYLAMREDWHRMAQEMRRLEEENNRIFIEAYGLQDELTASEPLDEVTLDCNPHYRYGSTKLKTRNWANFQEQFPDTAQEMAVIAEEMAPDMPEEDRLGLEQRLLDDTMREFISYAVGCMFGRYSLDKPGLILANQGETVDDYLRQVPDPTFMPDRDNVIPMLEGDWFTDDIAERFKRFLRVTFGEEHYEENLAFIEAALNRDIRGYFLRNFYDHHVKMYSKRPIYWLFSSPKGSFNALIYMHRYRPDTVSVVLNDYLREFRTKLTARKSHLQQVERSAGASKRDKTAAVKEIDRIDKILNELQAYEDDVLYPLATEQVDIDLDDGVLVNYNKFGKALSHVRGLSGKA